jgi:hypothetical protein
MRICVFGYFSTFGRIVVPSNSESGRPEFLDCLKIKAFRNVGKYPPESFTSLSVWTWVWRYCVPLTFRETNQKSQVRIQGHLNLLLICNAPICYYYFFLIGYGCVSVEHGSQKVPCPPDERLIYVKQWWNDNQRGIPNSCLKNQSLSIPLLRPHILQGMFWDESGLNVGMLPTRTAGQVTDGKWAWLARVGVELQLYTLFNFGTRWCGCSRPLPGCFTPGNDTQYPF